MIISRYLRREVIFTSLTVTTMAVFIFLCNRFVHYLNWVAAGKYGADVLMYLVLLQVPVLYGLFLPLGLFLGVLLGYSRLYADSEMVILYASGMTPRWLLKNTLKIAAVMMLIVAVLVILINPLVLKNRDRFLDLARTSTLLDTLIPGQFRLFMGGEKVIYVERLSRDRKMFHHIFIAERDRQQKGWTVLSSNKGYQQTDANTGDQFMVMEEGYRYQAIPGIKKMDMMQYKTYGVRLEAASASGASEGVEALSTKTLWQGRKQYRDYMAELQWRLSAPLSVLLLAIIAVPLSRVRPREGRFMKLFPAFLIYIIYINLLLISSNGVSMGVISSSLGLIWVHVLMLILGIVLWVRARGD